MPLARSLLSFRPAAHNSRRRRSLWFGSNGTTSARRQRNYRSRLKSYRPQAHLMEMHCVTSSGQSLLLATVAMKRIERRRKVLGSPNRCFVRFWPKADMSECTAHVRLWPLADIEDWAVRTLYRNGTQPSGPRRMHIQSIEQFRQSGGGLCAKPKTVGR